MRAILAGTLFVISLVAGAQDVAWRDSLESYWAKLDREFADLEHSPLDSADREAFDHLHRFPADPAFRVLARFKPARKVRSFGMRTSTDRVPEYRKVGVLHFMLDGRKEELHVYQNVKLSEQEPYRNYFFVPFTDLTNGEETYGGGRYLDLWGPLGEQVELDLNRAYNPYCAYSHRYSCPIPPAENHLPLRVTAGVLKFHD